MTLNQTSGELLDQLKEIILQLEPGDYSKPVPVLNQGTLGQHIRHTIEFFLCLVDGRNQGVINYDHRKHDIFIEQDAKLAMSVISSIQSFLQTETSDFQLELEANYDLSGDANIKMPSSYFRELAYNIEHTIHHMALLKIAVQQSFHYVSLPAHFGVASSTVRFMQQRQD